VDGYQKAALIKLSLITLQEPKSRVDTGERDVLDRSRLVTRDVGGDTSVRRRERKKRPSRRES
jgi:hypothetical protein